MRSLSRRAIRCEEWSKVAIDDKTGPLSSSDVHAIFATWKGTTGTDPTRYFETGPNHLLPKFWSGILHCANFSFEVLPIGGLSLQPSDKSQLDRNLSEMLTTVLGGSSIQATAGEISSTGSREDVLLLAFCNAFQLARRVRVIRSYSSITRQGRTLSGRLSFPRQSILDVASPGTFASTLLAFSEDTAENRLVAEVFRRFRPKCGPAIRRHIDACHGELGYVAEGIDASKEWSRIRFDRLPKEYKTLMLQARALLDGNFSGLFGGEVVSTSEIVFTSRLFERYVAGEFAQILAEMGYELAPQIRGSYLCVNSKGQSTFELIPDILIRHEKVAVVVADTKWKRLTIEKKGLGISPEDVYQSLTYAAYFGCKKIALVFPNTSSTTGRKVFTHTLSANLHGVNYKIEVIGLPMISSIREGCREAAKILIDPQTGDSVIPNEGESVL